MQLPDESGRAMILRHYLKPLKLDVGIDIDALVADIAAATDGASGADLEYLCQSAARLCIKDAVIDASDPDTLCVTEVHLRLAAQQIVDSRRLRRTIGLQAPSVLTP